MYLLLIVMRHVSSQQNVIFSKMDLDTVIISIILSRFLEIIFVNINCFNILTSLKDNSKDDKDNLKLISYRFDIEFLLNPCKITASFINKERSTKKKQQ